jgi:YfiH family protein
MAGASNTTPLQDALHPDWVLDHVGALMSTRRGGLSAPPWASLNLGIAVGDDPEAVDANRARFAAATGAAPVFMKQVHGTRVLRLVRASASAPLEEADAAITTERGLACTVQVADCLPVLLATTSASATPAVGAAHAGWRGLAGGVLDNTVAALCQAAGCEPAALVAWLGPCIGPERFEVGPDVLQAFGEDPQHADPALFRSHAAGKWMANLSELARRRLVGLGVTQIKGGAWCTVDDASRFFSFRRDRITGRMAAAVWLR